MCNPLQILPLKERMKGVNASVLEQTVSWFRGYAGTFNSMSSEHHRYYVRSYARKHNHLVASKNLGHLSKFSAWKRLARVAGICLQEAIFFHYYLEAPGMLPIGLDGLEDFASICGANDFS